MPENKRTIGYLCPVCGKAVVVERSEFQLAASDSRLPCPCGKSELTIRQMSLSCSASGLGCCYIGQEDAVFQAMEQLEQAVDKLVMDGQTDRRGAFLDEVVMGEVLGEVKEIAARGGIACGCGSAEYGVKVGFSAVDLVCARCGATLRLNAATPDDIDAVCAQYTLTIPGKKEQGL